LGDRRNGACRCGRIGFIVDGAPLITMACHCTGCQRMTASAFSLSSLFAASSLDIVAGEPATGGLRGASRHYFCPFCMSWLFTRPEGLHGFVNVRSTLLDDALSYRPFIETYTKEKLPWAATGAVHSFDTVPDPDSFPTLLAEFAELSGAGHRRRLALSFLGVRRRRWHSRGAASKDEQWRTSSSGTGRRGRATRFASFICSPARACR
jgi:hypothetical protein